MSTMADKQSKRTRRSFSEEFKAGAVRLVLEEGKTVGAAARDLDLTESSLRNWSSTPARIRRKARRASRRRSARSWRDSGKNYGSFRRSGKS